MPGNRDLQQRLASIEELLGKIEATADPSLRTTVQELVEVIMNLHGAGLERMLELIRATGDQGEFAIQKLASDELAASLLILYGLHPLRFEERINQALDQARPRLRPHGGEVEVLSVQDGAVRLRLHANGQGCGSTAHSLKGIVEEAVYQAAPDLTTLSIEGAEDKHEDKRMFVPLEMLLGRTVCEPG